MYWQLPREEIHVTLWQLEVNILLLTYELLLRALTWGPCVFCPKAYADIWSVFLKYIYFFQIYNFLKGR